MRKTYFMNTLFLSFMNLLAQLDIYISRFFNLTVLRFEANNYQEEYYFSFETDQPIIICTPGRKVEIKKYDAVVHRYTKDTRKLIFREFKRGIRIAVD